jgi:tetratricopeptide (TPR) repeat protein
VTDPDVTSAAPIALGPVTAHGDRAAAVQGDGNFTVTGDLVIRFPGTDDLVAPPATLTAARRMMFGSSRPAPMGRSPLRWLSADAGIVAAHPRADVEELLDWVENPDGLLVRLVVGAGGQGKTVLGRLVCRAVEGRGHLAGFVRLPPPSWRGAGADVGGQLAGLGWAKRWAEVISAALASTVMSDGPVLMVIDYAENHVEAIGDLLSQIVAAPDGVERTGRLRVLLLARHTHGWWERLCSEHPDHTWVDPDPIRLEALTTELTPDEGASVWAGALTAFAGRAVPDPAEAASTATHLLSRAPAPPVAATTLDLFAAALLLVLDHLEQVPGDSTVGDRDPLTGVLDHEATMLTSILVAAGASLDRRQVQNAMIVAYLTSPPDADTAAAALRAAPALAGVSGPDITRTADALSAVYPDPDGQRWVAPTPDRLPDTHLLRLLQDAASDADAIALINDWTSTTPDAQAGTLMARLTRALSTPGAQHYHPRGLSRLSDAVQHLVLTRDLTYLMAAIDLDPLVHRSVIEQAIANLSHQDAGRVDAQLRRLGFATTRTDIAVALSERLMQHWNTTAAPRTNPDPTADRAGDLSLYATRLAQVGRREAALGPAEEATGIYRGLAEANPAAHQPDLAMSLNNLGIRLWGVGRREEALGPAEEAVTIYRGLAQANPAAYLSDLAASLNNLGTSLSQVGRREEALGPAEEAATIYRRLAEANPAAHLPDLATSLNNLGTSLSQVGLRREALGPAEEATTIRRRLAEANPAAHLPDLARSLNNLGTSLSQVGRREEALGPAEEAVAIYRRLAEANPAAYLSDLASSLNNLGTSLSQVGRREEALGSAMEAVTIRRGLAEANPAAYLPDLAGSLNNLGNRLSQVGRQKEALGSAMEAVTIRRGLAEANPAAHLPDLATSLNNLGAFFSQLGRREEALGLVEEAIGIYRRLAEAHPVAYLSDLARYLNNFGIVLWEVGRREEALGAAVEAVTIRRRLAEANPAAHLPALAMSLWAMARICDESKLDTDTGLLAAQEAVEYFSALAERIPAAYAAAQSEAVNTLASLLNSAGRGDEAAEIRRRLHEGN